MIEITQSQYDQIEELRRKRRLRGLKLNTRIIYDVWHLFFGVKKRPNGCNACLRADMNQFYTKWEQLSAKGEIQIAQDTK